MAQNEYTQANRLIAVETELGEDILLLRAFQMRDELGRPFVAELELRSLRHDIKFEEIIGKNVTIRVQQTDGETRYINGFVSRFVQEGHASKGRINRYRATVVPWLWFLTRTADCRIFQNMTVPDVLKKVFEIHSFSDVDMKAKPADYEKREFIVQYRETAFNFISRLMEEEGIFYFFKHENGKHTMVITDKPAAHEEVKGYETVDYDQQQGKRTGKEHVWGWRREQNIQPGVFALRDFDFKNPSKLLDSDKATAQQKHSLAKFEVFDYPGFYETKEHGDRAAAVRIEELDAQHEVCHAEGDATGLVVGAKFKLHGFPREDQDREYVVTGAVYTGETDEFGAGGQGGGGSAGLYQVSFTAIPFAVPYRTPRTTPKPSIGGPQTAIVAGKDGDEIHTDEFARIKVKFHWDRLPGGEDKKPDETSCWVRVAQVWAGAKWGGMFIPRVGQEVIVEFLEGDPDRPIVTGRVYNTAPGCPVPYTLPDMKTISTIKSSSSKGGEGFNEIRFEDKKGEEEIFVHAEKDMQVRVKNDRTELILNNQHLVVKKDYYTRIEQDRHSIIKRDRLEEITRNNSQNIAGDSAVLIEKTLSLHVKGDVAENFDANHHEKTKEDIFYQAKKIVIEGEENITLRVGKTTLAMTADGLKIETTGQFVVDTKDKVTITSVGDFSVESKAKAAIKGTAGLDLDGTAKAEMKSAMTTVKSDGILTIQGSMVKIN